MQPLDFLQCEWTKLTPGQSLPNTEVLIDGGEYRREGLASM